MPNSISSNDRILITGKTGSGKTYLANHLTRYLTRLIVIDSKGTLSPNKGWDLQPYENVKRELQSGKNARARALPPLKGDMNSWLSEIFEFAYSCGNVVLYIDEMYAVSPPNQKPPQSLIACYTRGRELGLGVWAATQRPVWIPLFALSEADHFFMFRLSLDEDRKRMAAFMGPAVLHTIYDMHGFYYSSAIDERPVYYKQLKTREFAKTLTPTKNGLKS